jgi:hypothetical protein
MKATQVFKILMLSKYHIKWMSIGWPMKVNFISVPRQVVAQGFLESWLAGLLSPSPLGDQERCSKEGKGQPPPAARPCQTHPPAAWDQERGTVSSSSNNNTSALPISQASQQHTPPPATILHNMFSTCQARGKAAKLVYKRVGGKVRDQYVFQHCSSYTNSSS